MKLALNSFCFSFSCTVIKVGPVLTLFTFIIISENSRKFQDLFFTVFIFIIIYPVVCILQLLETMVKNCGDYVHFQVADRNILQEMVKIVKKKV